ncbi:hypothetical protein [Metabacillus sp. 84]|uniref:hypothetical protein n=1 Tax=unclassified Metabacillus TaxID=2675274 RepID=UPI003CF3BD8F
MSHQIKLRADELTALSSQLKAREKELLEVQQGFVHSYYKASSHYPNLKLLEVSYHSDCIKKELEKLIEAMSQLSEIAEKTPSEMSRSDQEAARQFENTY